MLALEIIGGVILFIILIRIGALGLVIDILFAILSGGSSSGGSSSGGGFGGGDSGGGGASGDW